MSRLSRDFPFPEEDEALLWVAVPLGMAIVLALLAGGYLARTFGEIAVLLLVELMACGYLVSFHPESDDRRQLTSDDLDDMR